MRSDDEHVNEPTGQTPVVTSDSGVTFEGAELASDFQPAVDPETLLPHWTDAPTGQVPIVVARDSALTDDPWAQIPAPAWREGQADWDAHEQQFDASVLAASFGDEPLGETPAWDLLSTEEIVAESAELDDLPRPALEPDVPEHDQPLFVSTNPLAGRVTHQRPSQRAGGLGRAIVTGVLLALVVAGFFLAGRIPMSALVIAVMGLATAEAYAGFRQHGQHPATIFGIVGVVTLAIATYNRGLLAFAPTTVLFVAGAFLWYVRATRHLDVLSSYMATLFAYLWIGGFGSFALLILSPRTTSGQHGLDYLFGAILLTISNDTGALFIGRWIGNYPLSPQLSPKKTREGALGGALVTMLVGAIILPMLSPWTVTHGLELGIVVALVAPMGDLFESMVKRSFQVKDLGRLLPGHGGLLDRIDGLLFVLPATYFFLHVLNLR